MNNQTPAAPPLRSRALEEESFQDAMHEAMGRAPWLMLSILAHAVAALVLYVILEEPLQQESNLAMAVQQEQQQEELEQEKPEDEPLEEVKTEEVDPQVEEPTEVDDNDSFEDSINPDDTPIQSAFTSNQWNTSTGIGGGAAGSGGFGGRYGDGGGKPRYDGVTGPALEWLARHQDEDGRWDADGFMKHDTEGERCTGAGNPVHDVGVTGLALLAFLGDGNDLVRGKYRENVKRAARWLRSQQDEQGRFGPASHQSFIYDHAIATLALCECMGMSRSSVLRRSVVKAIGYLEQHRNPYGAWRYVPRSGDQDSSITGWALMALKSARDFDIPVDKNSFKAVLSVFDELTDPVTGRCGYQTRGTMSSRESGDHGMRFPAEHGEALTAVALMSRIFLGQDPKEHEVMGKGTELLLAKLPTRSPGAAVDHYYWYYGSYAMFQLGGSAWRRWQKALLPTVIKSQRKDGNFAGSWDPDGVWGENGGRVYSTAILALTMQVYHRYTRVLLR